MKYTFTDRILLFLADIEDLNMCVRSVNNELQAAAGDPRFHKHRIWIERCIKEKKNKKKINSIIHALKLRGFLKIIKHKNYHGYILTQRGERRVNNLKMRGLTKKKLPNDQLLMVFFDIPEQMRRSRDAFRSMLKILGFEQLQKSIWVTPYDVLKEIRELINEHNIRKHVKFLLVKEFYE